MGVVGGAEAAGGAGAARTRGPVGGSGRAAGGGGGGDAGAGGGEAGAGGGEAGAGGGEAGAGGGEAGTGGEFRGAGVNTDSNGTATVGSSGDSGASGTPTAWPTCAVDGGGPGGKGGFGRLQAEKGGSGLDTGGNSDSGGPDGDISRASAGAAE